jgi:hypothetical protein
MRRRDGSMIEAMASHLLRRKETAERLTTTG